MARRTLLVTAAVAVAAISLYWFVQRNPDVTERLGLPAPAVDANPELLSRSEATEQRAEHYQHIDSIAETLELPSNFARREALHVIAGRADKGKLRSLVSEAKRVSDPWIRLDALEILLLRYVEIDPAAALKSAQETDRSSAAKLVAVVLGAWSRTDLESAIAAAKSLPADALRTAAAHAIVASNPSLAGIATNASERKRLAARLGVRENSDAFVLEPDPAQLLDDPARAIEDALALPAGDARRQQLVRIAQAWARVAPEEALEHAANLSDAAARMVFENTVVETWSSNQPELAFAYVSRLPNDGRRDQLLRQVTGELASRDPAHAMQLVTGMKGVEKSQLQTIVADEWARYDPASAAKWVEGLGRMQQGAFGFRIGDAYVMQNPDEALAWALRISRSPGRNLWSAMVGKLATVDPDQALRIALSAENPAQRTQALSNVLGSIAIRDPALALSHLEKLPAGMMRSRATVQIASSIAENSSPAAAVDWLLGLNDGGSSLEEALPQVASMMAWRDPDAAAQLVDRIPGSLRSTWIMQVAAAFADQDVEKGIQWVRRFDDDPNATGIQQTFAMSLAQRSPEAAMDFIERVADGRERDDLIRNVLPMLAMQTPETAVRYYSKISDPEMRVQTMQIIASQWARYDPAAAQKWVMSMPSSPGRDNAMVQLIQGNLGVDDTLSLLGQMQSADRRQEAVMMAALRLQRTNPEDARTLLRRHPLDPTHQQQYEMLQQQPNRRGAYSWVR